MTDNSDQYYSEAVPTEYKRIKVGVKNLDDAVLNLVVKEAYTNNNIMIIKNDAFVLYMILN